MPFETVTLHICDAPGGNVIVMTTAGTPAPGRRLTPSQALATDLLSTCTRRAREVRYWQGDDPALALLRELVDPEGYGHAVPAEVRRRAAAVLGRWPLETQAGDGAPQETASTFDLVAHVRRQAAFSAATFGPGARVEGVIDHIARELLEVRDSDGALAEWVDVIILGLDGAWRSGASAEQIAQAIADKQARNESRTWPDWRSAAPGKAIEHVRGPHERRARRVYLSGPMSGIEAHNFPAFHAAASRLRARGLSVINPAEINTDADATWHECLRRDMAALALCDTLALLPGWQTSSGAHLELHVAHRLGIEIVMAEELEAAQ